MEYDIFASLKFRNFEISMNCEHSVLLHFKVGVTLCCAQLALVFEIVKFRNKFTILEPIHVIVDKNHSVCLQFQTLGEDVTKQSQHLRAFFRDSLREVIFQPYFNHLSRIFFKSGYLTKFFNELLRVFK